MSKHFDNQRLIKDAKKRKQQWDEEQGEGSDGVIVFIIIVAVAILIGDFLLRFIY